MAVLWGSVSEKKIYKEVLQLLSDLEATVNP